MIIQGTNIPIEITFEDDVSSMPKIVATLWQQNKLLKKWEREDMSVTGVMVTLPLKEDETRKWNRGKASLEIKGLTNMDQVMFWEEAEVEIVARKDKDVDLVEEA